MRAARWSFCLRSLTEGPGVMLGPFSFTIAGSATSASVRGVNRIKKFKLARVCALGLTISHAFKLEPSS